MFCDCPYAAEGECCKHMAAVLYAIEEEDPELEKAVTEEGGRISSVIALIPEKELRSLVLSLAQEDKSLQNALLSKYSKSLEPWQIKSFQDEFFAIIEDVSDRHGFIDYKNASFFEHRAEKFLERRVGVLIEKGQFREAFEVSKMVYTQLGSLEIDDSNGTIMTIAGDCCQIWSSIFQQCSKEEEQEMFKWILDCLEDSLASYLEEGLIDFWMNEFPEKEQLLQKLDFLDSRIERLRSGPQNSWSNDYDIQSALMKRLKVMEQLECSRDEMAKFMGKYHQYSDVRQWEIDLAVKETRYKDAISLLKESKSLDCGHAGLVAKYSKQLMELYQSCGQTEKYKKELIDYVIQKNYLEMNYVLKLKQVCTSEEWEKYRTLLLKKTDSSFRYELMEKEGMYRQLLDEIISRKSIYPLDQYERVLKDKFPDEVRDMYLNFVKSQAENACDRKTYYELAAYLAKAAKYPGGRPLAEAIAAEWRVSYKRRRAMMEELDKAGFAEKVRVYL